jgi:hypothetical protein
MLDWLGFPSWLKNKAIEPEAENVGDRQGSKDQGDGGRQPLDWGLGTATEEHEKGSHRNCVEGCDRETYIGFWLGMVGPTQAEDEVKESNEKNYKPAVIV